MMNFENGNQTRPPVNNNFRNSYQPPQFTSPFYFIPGQQYPFPVQPQNPQQYYFPPKLDINCHKCVELQNEVSYLSSQMKLMNKNIELLNEQVKLLDMKLSISNSLQKNENIDTLKKQNHQDRNKNNTKRKNNSRLDMKSEFNFTKANPFVPPLVPPTENANTKKDTSTAKTILNGDINSEPTFIIQFDDFGSGPFNNQTNSAKGPESNNPFGLLGSLLNIFTNSKKQENNNEITNIEATEELEISDHDSDEEFEELNIEIKTIDDLINLGHKYDDIIKQEKQEKQENQEKQEKQEKETNENEKAERTFVKQKNNPSKFNFDKVLMRDGSVRSLKNDKEIIKPDVKTTQDEDLNKDCVINGKKYSINLKVLYKLIKPLTKLKTMIGLDNVKNAIIDMILYYLQNFEKKNNNMLHTVIEGPPGVGKTQLGKILAEVYAGLGVIPSSKFKIVKRSDLVGEYLGHTAPKTQKVIDEADGGVLFIDEAYSLGNEDKKDSFSKECIDVINQNLSENKKKFICIIAGYPDELDRCFFSYNPGLKRRFPFKFRINGYTSEELKNIFLKKISDIKWKLNDSEYANKELSDFFNKNKENFPFYGGDIDNFLLNCKFVHSRRVFGRHPKNKRKFNKYDIETGFDRFIQNKKKEEENLSYRNMFV